MPELPEVETTCRGLEPLLTGKKVLEVLVHNGRLRWPVSLELALELPGSHIRQVRRRAKYLLLDTKRGTVLIHLGMSGSLRVIAMDTPLEKHDHVEFILAGGQSLRLRDPRRFGAVLWTREAPEAHRLLCTLGPEPLGETFDGDYLHHIGRQQQRPIKSLIMDGKVVVGVGNIYACEALFAAGIHPLRAAQRISLARYRALVAAIREVLAEAIKAGGTTLRDFSDSQGRPGYFSQQLQVYGRAGEDCRRCGVPLRRRVIAQRGTFYCPVCQR